MSDRQNLSESKVLEGIIIVYRKLIDDRYQYQKLKGSSDLPDSISKDQIDEIRNYFLTFIYPDLQQRLVLNDAFESLDHFIKNPGKLLQILVDSVSLVVKHGRYLPKILRSGIKALRSFREASFFEKQLVQKAIESKIEPPYTEANIHHFIRQINRDSIDEFIESTRSLFNVLHDRKQVSKIKEIIAFLIAKMKKQPKSYSKDEIKALEIGFELIDKGDQLFERIGKENQQLLIDFIVTIENKALDHIFASK